MFKLLFGSNSNFVKTPWGFASGSLVAVIWASWYIVSRKGLIGNLTPADITLIRYLTGTLLTLPMLWWIRGKTIPWKVILILVLSYGFPYTLALFQGLKEMQAAKAGIILNGLLPIVNTALAWVFFRQGVGIKKWLAILALAFANFLMIQTSLTSDSLSWAVLWIIAATLLFGVYMSTIRKWQVDMVVLLPMMSIGNFILFLPFWYFLPRNIGAADFSEIALQAVFQGLINQVVVIWLVSYTVRRIGSISTSVLYGFVPSLTALFAWFILNETLSLQETVAILICSLGIIAFSRSK